MFGDSKMQFILIVLLALIGVCSSSLWICYECSTSSSSTNCSTGYYLNNGYCCPCGDNRLFPNCSTSPPCTACQSGYYLNNGSCNQCSSQCLECSTSSSCTACQSGYYLNKGYCYQCSWQCAECRTSRFCTSCQSGYYLNNDYCYQCTWQCLECSASSSCTACQSGYYLNNGYCSPCGSPCLECRTPSSCTACQSGYYLNNGYCSPCSSPCLECSTSSFCISCQSGYYHTERTCVACDVTCSSCSNTTGACTSCPHLSFLLDGRCVPCSENCLSCYGISGICDKCKQEYYGNYCQVRCDEHCNGSICEHITGECINGCKVGYYQMENKCVNCPTNCTTCQNNAACTNCTEDHHLNTLSDGSVICSSSSTCEQSKCINHGETNSDSGNKHTGEIDSTAIIAGAIGGGCVIVVVVFILVLVVYKCRRNLSPQPDNCRKESPEVSIPSVLYVNTSNPDNFNEPVGEPTTYESLSRRDDDNDNYSSLNKALCVDD